MKEKKDFNVEMGRRIKVARERARITREYLAELVDITPRFVADIERGSVGLSVPNLKRLCEVLNISSDSILWEKTTQTSIDEKLRFIGEEYIEQIDKMIQVQLELINMVKNKN